MGTAEAKFKVGQVVHHRLFDYRGVVIDVDPFFRGPDEPYKPESAGRPVKDRPWYHVLVDGAEHRTYVAESNLEPDALGGPIDHPAVRLHFRSLQGSDYEPLRKMH
ncbi:MAG: heat shock protein HspQ [Magnetospirillum sp. WYHS-4]